MPDLGATQGPCGERTEARPLSVLLVRPLCSEGEPEFAEPLGLELACGLRGPALVTPDEWACAHRPQLERYARLGCAVNIQTSRGCPGKCTFCATPSLPAELSRWRPRSVRLVVDEMQAVAARLGEAGLPAVFNFVDDDFGPLSRLEELAQELERRGPQVAFACEMRLASLVGQKNLGQRLARLARTGLTRIFVGVESLEPSTLRRWNKPYDVNLLPEFLAACRAAGIAVQAGYIMWHSHQTVTGALNEAERLRSLGIYSHRAALSRLIVLPGCALATGTEASFALDPIGPTEQAFLQEFQQQTKELTRRWTRGHRGAIRGSTRVSYRRHDPARRNPLRAG